MSAIQRVDVGIHHDPTQRHEHTFLRTPNSTSFATGAYPRPKRWGAEEISARAFGARKIRPILRTSKFVVKTHTKPDLSAKKYIFFQSLKT